MTCPPPPRVIGTVQDQLSDCLGEELDIIENYSVSYEVKSSYCKNNRAGTVPSEQPRAKHCSSV